jgi:hypothetical protein
MFQPTHFGAILIALLTVSSSPSAKAFPPPAGRCGR